MLDPFLFQAGYYIAGNDVFSIGMLMKSFGINFSKGCAIMEQLEKIGLLSKGNRFGKYSVSMNKKTFVDTFLSYYVSLRKEPAKWSSIRDPLLMEIEADTVDLKNVIIFFKNGVIYDVFPDVYNYYKAQFYYIDGNMYDSYSVESIKEIPVPDYSLVKSIGTPVYNLEYILRMRASEEHKSGNIGLYYQLYHKSIQLMKFSNVSYSKSDFTRLENWLYEDGRIQEAEKLKAELQKDPPLIFDESSYRQNIFYEKLEMCHSINTDYIYCTPHAGSCPECAKYQARVYCISGADPRLPKLPNIVMQTGGFHKGCLHSFYPFYIDVVQSIKGADGFDHEAIAYSNRPYIDDRSDEDRALYLEKVKNIERRRQLEIDRENYHTLLSLLPDDAPKSFASFRSQKRHNSISYQNLKEIAKKYGLDI